ncbi:hypothetical protein IH779_00215 [Patescibacteria group bacterium]|nr:hypothetical protein [Patescibacteria group bacterium]
MMNRISQQEALEKFNANIQMRVPILVSYFLVMIFLKEGIGIPFPYIAFFLVALMLLSSLILDFYFDRFPPRGETIINVYFLYTIIDLFFLTLIIYYFGGITWLGFIFYSFYFISNFMTFFRWQAVFLSIWIISLYLIFVLAQYLQVFPSFSIFLPRSQTYFNFLYVIATSTAYISTFILVAYFSHGFYQLYAGKIVELQKTQEMLEEEKVSLEARVESRKKELEKERKSLEERIQERKKELENEEARLRERAEELEKFQKITTGREEKIKKLRAELDHLQAKN